MKISKNSAISYSLLLKIWQAAAGVVSIIFIGKYFEPALQGFYYTFASLIALQSFFELGLYLVISVSASHEWSKLRIANNGGIIGDRDAHSRLVSLGRFVFRWYGIAAFLFLALAAFSGLLFFGKNETAAVDWKLPWLLHVVFSAALLWLNPFLSLLEGCDQFASTSKVRLIQSICTHITFWVAVYTGMALWAVPALSLVSLSIVTYYVLIQRRRFFESFFNKPESAVFSWRTELLPMQWRLALQGFFSYLSFPLYTALVFSYFGAAEAGRMGMTLQIVTAVQSFSLVFVTIKAPALAISVAKANSAAMRRDWRTASLRSMVSMFVLVLILFLTLVVLAKIAWPPIDRVLSPLAFLLFSVGAIFGLLIQCIAIYLRAYKREKLTQVGVISGLLYGLFAWGCVSRSGSMGVAWTYFLITAFVSFPMSAYIYKVCDREWRLR